MKETATGRLSAWDASGRGLLTRKEMTVFQRCWSGRKFEPERESVKALTMGGGSVGVLTEKAMSKCSL